MANKYWVGGGATTNWNATGNTNWSDTSGGANNATIPAATDNVFFDTGSSTCVINSASYTVVNFIVLPGFTGTIQHTNNITIKGDITLHPNYTTTGVGAFTLDGPGNYTCNGRVWGNNIGTGNTAGSRTFVDSWTVGLLSMNIVTVTLLAPLIATTVQINPSSAPVFAGTAGWTAENFTSNVTGGNVTLTLQEGITYVINKAMTGILGRTGGGLLTTSSHATNRANLQLKHGATCNVLGNFTRIDASGVGTRPIRIFAGTITNCVNISLIGQLKTIASTF